MKKRRIILDCDTKAEIDDQFAITYALNHPAVDLLGIVSVQNNRVSGEGSVGLYLEEAQRIVDLGGYDTPCFQGAVNPLTVGSGGWSAVAPEKSEGIDFIIDQAGQYGDKLTLVATGPATDIASALLTAPEIVSKCPILFIGGFRTPADLSEFKGRECNFDGDPAAFGVLMNSSGNVTVLPAWGVTDTMMVQCRVLAEQLRETGNVLADYLADLVDSTGDRHRIFWDIAAVAAAVDLGVEITYRAKPFTVLGTEMKFPRDWDAPEPGEPSIRLIDRIDEFTMLQDARLRILEGLRS